MLTIELNYMPFVFGKCLPRAVVKNQVTHPQTPCVFLCGSAVPRSVWQWDARGKLHRCHSVILDLSRLPSGVSKLSGTLDLPVSKLLVSY